MAKKIEKLRKEIDKVDEAIVNFLFKRINLAEKILKEKRNLNLPLTDLKREEEIVEKLKNITRHPYLETLISQIYPLIFNLGKKKVIFEENKNLPFQKIGVIGLGLIGGSIIKAIKEKKPKVEIFTLFRKEDKDIKLAQKGEYLDKIFKNTSQFLNEIELLIIATPIKTINLIARKVIKNYKGKNSLLVIDTGSTKELIVREFQELSGKNIDFLGTHPLAGSDKQGFLNSSPILFLNYPWIITPHKKNKQENIRKVENLINFLGARPIKMKAKEHDLKLAYGSHLIFLISRFLFAFGEKKNILLFTGSGFESLTRLASASPEMHLQILKTNEKNIKKAFEEFLKFLKEYRFYLRQASIFFKKTKSKRDSFYKRRHCFL